MDHLLIQLAHASPSLAPGPFGKHDRIHPSVRDGTRTADGAPLGSRTRPEHSLFPIPENARGKSPRIGREQKAAEHGEDRIESLSAEVSEAG